MKTTFGMTGLLLLTLCVAGGSIVAQEGAVATGAAANVQSAPASSSAIAQVEGALPDDSHVRIVRLSDVQGGVTLDRNTGRGLEPTMRNMPIVEGGKLQTEDGFAEVEFEDDSTLRVAPGSQIEFPQMVLRKTGAKASTVKLVKGTMYVSLTNAKDNEFTIQVGSDSVRLLPSTHLRLEMAGTKVMLAVFAGSAEVKAESSTTMVGKKQTLTLGATGEPMLAKNVEEGQYDGWDKDLNSYHQRYAKGNSFAGSPYSYGISDLNYYGSFVNFGGCGQMWQPYFVSAAWNPYSNGAWAWYPGAGYSWVSPYPWGWMPFHSGSWSYCSTGGGWGWRPGNNWVGLRNVSTNNPIHPRPPLPPSAGRPTMMMSSSAPLAISKVSAPGSFTFKSDSAGLGVPRGSLGNLGKISSGVEKHGSVSTPVYAVPLSATGSGPVAKGTTSTAGRAGSPSAAPVALRTGSPSAGPQGGYSGSQSSGGFPSSGGATSSAPVSHPMGGGAPTGMSPGSAGGSSGSRGGTSPK